MEEIIYFEINNWFAGENYPPCDPFIDWVAHNQFNDSEWCKANKLVVVAGPIDMSMNWCVAAPRSWVEANCPCLLSDDEFTYKTQQTKWNKETDKMEWETIEHHKKYSKFLLKPNEDGDVYGRHDDWAIPDYCEKEFGVHWNNSWWGDDEDEDEEEEE